MRRDTASIGRKSLSYLISEPAQPAIPQRPHSTIVFLHAFPLQSAMWEPNLGAMPGGWRAVAPDFRWEPGIGMADVYCVSPAVGKKVTKGEIPPWRPSVRSGGVRYCVNPITRPRGVKNPSHSRTPKS